VTTETLHKSVADSSDTTVLPAGEQEYCPNCGKAIAHLPLKARRRELRGKTTVIHAEDLPKLQGRSFYCDRNKRLRDGTLVFYARQRYGDRPGLRLHTLLLELHGVNLKDRTVDHKNHDKLDNRVGCNIRPATQQQNNLNRRPFGKSGYKGVKQKGDRFIARICVDGKEEHLGTFMTVVEAIEAYNNKAIEVFDPEFVYLNPLPVEQEAA